MNFWKKIFPFLLLSFVAVFFFRKTFFQGLIPFPGDLLVSEYQPFRSYSYLGYAPGAVPNKAQYFDSIREFYPWRTQVADQLKKGELPFWNPYNFSGSPLLANYQTAVFYPLNLLYLFLDQVNAWSILIILQPLLASFFTYLYVRKIGIGLAGAILAAIAFAYSSYMTVWLEFNTVGQTILWLPLILYSMENILQHKFTTIRKTLVNKWSLLLIFSLTSSLFAGHPLDFAAVYLFSFIYGTFRFIILILRTAGEFKLKSFIIHNSLFIIPLIIGSIQLLPTIELLARSTRVAFSYDFFLNKMLIQPYQLIMLFIPDFFGNPATRNFWLNTSYVGLTFSIGLTPLIFISLLVFNFNKIRNRENLLFIKFFLLSTGLILLFTLNTPFTRLFYKLQVPLISTSSPTKLLSVFVFSLSILAGFGLDFYLKKSKYLNNLNCFSKIKPILPFILAFLLVWMSLTFIPQEYFKASFRNTLYSTGILVISIILFLFGKLPNRWQVAKLTVALLILITIFDLHYAFSKFNPFSPKEFIFPDAKDAKILEFLQENAGINRFWGYGTAKIDANIATQYKLFSPDGFDALNLRWYNEFISSSKDGKIKIEFSHIDRSVAEIHPGYGETELPTNQYRLRVLDMLGVQYILDRAENPKDENTFPTDRFKLIFQDEAGWFIYENLKAAPRFFLTRDVKTYQTKDEFEKIFFAENFNPTTTILIEENDFNNETMRSPVSNGTGEQWNNGTMDLTTVSLKLYEPNKVVFEVNISQPAFLFLSDTFDYGWKVYIDGVETKIYKTNWAFRSVLIPEGGRQITFTYKPSVFQSISKYIK